MDSFNFDIEYKIAELQRLQKIAPIDKELHRLEMTLFKFVQKSVHSGNEAPSHIGEKLHSRFNQCRSDLTRLAMARSATPRLALPNPSSSITPNTPLSSSGDQIAREALEALLGPKNVDLTEWKAALKFIKCYTAWLLPFRDLIEDAQRDLFPPGLFAIKTRTVEHPAGEVVETARRISAVAAITPSRAIGHELKPRLWEDFETLLLIEAWYQNNRVLNPVEKR